MMEEFDIAGAALAKALGFSEEYTQTHARVICRGDDKNASQVILIVELRIQHRSGTRDLPEKPGAPRGQGTKSPGKPMTPRKSLLQSIVN